MRKSIAFIAAAGLTLTTSAALAHVIDPAVDKAAAKLRADIAKQVSKYTFCLAKAASGCEKKGITSATECSLATGAVAYEAVPGDATAKFQAAIAKCDSKMLLTKKSTNPATDYVAIGCPGDCNSVATGPQQCADINAFEATVESTATSGSAKVQLATLAGAIDFACGTDTGAAQTDPVRIDCVTDQAKLLSKAAQGIFKCQAKCENDFKASKGNGGPTNAPKCLAGDALADPVFNTCVNGALGKVTPSLTPTNAAIVLPLLTTAVNDATNGLYNRSDPTSTADASPCGNCGNATRQGAEECDGADAAACPGLCNTDCTCP